MKAYCLIVVAAALLCSFLPATAQFPKPAPLVDSAKPEDVKSADAIIVAVYDVISGPAGQKRDWNRMRSLFLPEATLCAVGEKRDGTFVRLAVSVEKYIELGSPLLEKEGFFEREAARHTDQYGNIMQVFSTYESRHAVSDEKPFQRGINSFQLFFDGKRWWIFTIYWQAESPKAPIPDKFLKNG